MSRNKKNKEKLKKSITTSIFFLLFFAGIGSLIIYRAYIPENKLTPKSGILKSVELKKIVSPLRKRDVESYSILLKLEGVRNLYGIYGGTKKQAIKRKNKLNLNLEKKYTILIDNSVVNNLDNTNLGVRIIKNGENIIFTENTKAEMFFGKIFILMGIISSLLFYYFARKKIE